VLPAIQLDDEPRLHAHEVGNVRAYRLLAAELPSGQRAIAQEEPQAMFCIGHVAAQTPRTMMFLAFAHRIAPWVVSSHDAARVLR